ncbi:MAG: diacylglycerol kinase family protein [Kofleriaceae bacterium]
MRALAIVNAQARGLTAKLRARLERALPGHVRFTDSLDDARTAIRAEVRRGVDLVILGGGDGTVVMGLTLIAEACRGHGKREPMLGILRMGTGNAIADTVNASSDVVADLERLARGAGTRTQLPLVEALGVRAPFVGLGIDAQLLEDQAAINGLVDRIPGSRLIPGATRYALSVALRSVPRFALRDRPTATVINAGAAAIVMTKDGERGTRTGELWRGQCTLVAGATIPYFGFGLKMFPFASSRNDRFHLRCGDVGLLEIMANTRSAFRGEYFSDNVADFLCDRVMIELDRETAIEAGGELLGRKSRVELALTPPVTLLSL